MKPSEMRRDRKVKCEALGVVTLVVPVGPHEMKADGSAVVKSIVEREEMVTDAVLDADFNVIKPAVFRTIMTEGGYPPPTWMALTSAFEMRVVEAARCEPVP
jgi:hypothetical protein